MRSREATESCGVALACGVAAVLTMLLYAPSLRHDFTGYDDPLYVDAAVVRRGVTMPGVVWAFEMGPGHAANWHPVTWLSHMLDSQFFGRRPGPQHAINVLIHALATAALLAALWRMTGALWPSVLVAMLFAWHPLHVQSVAWIAERKDVLSALFFFLSLWAYAGYARRPSAGRYAVVALWLAIGLMAKSMLVTAPFVMLLLDCWPLKRQARWGKLIVEKLPLVALCGAVAVLTVLAQREAGAVKGTERYPIASRVGNALVSYARYLQKTIVPTDLAIFYPYRYWAWWQVAAAAVVLIVITALCVWQYRRRYLIVGWLWFLGMLVPVIGLVQVGGQSMADRYTYLPLVGIFIMLAWRADEWSAGKPGRRRGASIALAAALLLLGAVTEMQLRYWRDDMALFTRVLEVTDNNWLAHGYVGKAYAMRREDELAQKHYEEALRLNGTYYEVNFNYANLLMRHGATERAEALYRRAIELKPDFAEAHNNLGTLLVRESRWDEAQAEFAAAAKSDPEYADAECNLARVMLDRGRAGEAIEHFERAIALQPDFPQARRGLEQARATARP